MLDYTAGPGEPKKANINAMLLRTRLPSVLQPNSERSSIKY